MSEVPKEIDELVSAVLEIEERYGYEMTNVATKRVSEIREKIDTIASSGASNEAS